MLIVFAQISFSKKFFFLNKERERGIKSFIWRKNEFNEDNSCAGKIFFFPIPIFKHNNFLFKI